MGRYNSCIAEWYMLVFIRLILGKRRIKNTRRLGLGLFYGQEETTLPHLHWAYHRFGE
jgi:hypothetical protein